MSRTLEQKSTTEQIRARFDGDVERFSNLETGQAATIDAPLVLELLSQTALAINPAPRRMLDVGCGAGNNTLKILQSYPHIACDLLDLSGAMLERAQQRVSAATNKEVRTFQGDFREVELESGYDFIVAAAVLHHLRDDADWEQGFRKLYDLLAPGGALLVSDLVQHATPVVQALMWERYGQYLESLGGPEYRAKVFDYIEYEDSPRPLSYQLELLRKVGFQEVEVLHKNSVFAAFYAVKEGAEVNQQNLEVIHTTVFSARAGGGNPCPVVFHGEALSSEAMRGLTARFGHETAFVLPADVAGADVKFRYFVPNHEMEMCVHATVAATSLLVDKRKLQGLSASVQTRLGNINVAWERGADGLLVLVEQFDPQFSAHNPSRAEVCEALGISQKHLAPEVGPIESVSVSRPKLMVPLKNWRVLDGLEPDFERLWALCDEYQTTGFYPFTLEVSDPSNNVEARQFPKRAGYPEDAATGVAAGALGAYLSRYRLGAGDHQIWVGQGRAMGRPSRILVKVSDEGGRVKVCGHAEVESWETLTLV